MSSPEVPPPAAALSPYRRVLFGLAGPPLQLTQNVVGLYLNVFLLEVARMRPLLISVVIFSGRLLDAVSGPVIGYGVSRTRTRFGMCRPWLLGAAPVSGLTFFGLWWLIPGGLGLAHYLLLYMLFSVAISCYQIPYSTLTVRISSVPSERDSATAYRMVFEMLGVLIGPTVFGFTVEPKRSSVICVDAAATANMTYVPADFNGIPGAEGNGTLREVSADEQNAYLIAAAAISSLVLLCGLAGFLGVREVNDAAEEREGAKQQSVREYLARCKQVVTYRPFLQATTTFITLTLSWHVFQAISILYITHVVRLGWHVRFCTLAYMLAALAAVPCWHMFAIRFGKKPALIIGSIGTTLCCLCAGVMPAGVAALFYILAVLSGILGANALLLTWAMLPDVIQAFYKERGCRLEAVFYSTFTFLSKCVVCLILAGLNLALDLANYDRLACVQPPSVITALRGLMLAPLPLLCLAILCAWRLPDDVVVGVGVEIAAVGDLPEGGAADDEAEKPLRQRSEADDAAVIA